MAGPAPEGATRPEITLSHPSRGGARRVSPAETPTMNATTTSMPRTCAVCGRRIDWSGADRRRAPGALEDGIVLCRDCVYRSEHREAA